MEKTSAIKELGISTAAAAGSGIIGGLMNHLFAGSNDRRQIRQQQKLTDMQVTANKQIADYEQELGLKMWKDTNYPAQVAMMKEAGLNPAAVLSNGGGGSGATGAGAQGVGGGQAANAAQTQANQNELGLQMAQMQLMQAQTEKTKAEAENIAGVDRENTMADTAVKQATAKIQEVAARVANETQEDQIKAITYAANEQVERARERFNIAQVAEETQQAEIAKIKASAISEGLNSILIENQIGRSRAETWRITEEIKQNWEKVAQGWKGLNIQDKNLKLQEFKTEIEAQYPNVWNVAGRAIDDMITEIVTLGGKLGERHKTKTRK